MASFTEQAILKLIDQTSSPANKANAALTRLWKTASKLDSKNVNIRVRTTGAQNAAQQLQALVRASGQSHVVRVDTSQITAAIRQAHALRGALGGMPMARPGASIPGGGFPMGGGRNALFGGPGPAYANAGRIMARAFTAAIGFEIYGAVRRGAGAAGRGILDEDSAVGSLRMMGLTADQVRQRRGMASDVSALFPELSRAMILDGTRELAGLANTAGDARVQMQNFGRTAVNLGVALGDMRAGAESARQLFRAGGLLGVAQDPARQAEFIDEMQRAIIASGGDIQGAEIRRMLQQMRGQGLDLSPQAIGDLTSLRDEGGMGSTAEARMFMNDLTRSNLNRRDLARQQAAGLRDAQGNTIERGELLANPIENVFNRIIPKLEKMGVDLDDAAAVQKALTGRGGLGLTTPGAAFAQRVISQRDQVQADRAARARVALNAAMEDPTLRQQAARIQAQFANAAAAITEGLKPTAGGLMDTLTGQLKTLSDPKASTLDKTAAAAAAAAAASPLAIGAVLANLPNMLADPRTAPMAAAGLALTGSAGALTGAAGALTAAAAAQSGLSMATLLGRAGVGAAIAAAIIGPIAYTEAGGKLSTDAEKMRRQLLERRNNPFGSSGEREKALREEMDAQRARGERIDAVKAEQDARAKLVGAIDRQIAAMDQAVAAERAKAAEKAANENKPALSPAQQRAADATQAQTNIGRATGTLKSLDEAEKQLNKSREKALKNADPIQRAAQLESIDEQLGRLPAAREKVRKEMAEAQQMLLKMYEDVDIGPAQKGEPAIFKRLRELRMKLDIEEAKNRKPGSEGGPPIPGTGGPRRPTSFEPEGEKFGPPIPEGFTPSTAEVVEQLKATFDSLPGKGAEAADGFVGGINAPGLGAAIGQAAGAEIRAAVANVQVTATVVNQPRVGTTSTTD